MTAEQASPEDHLSPLPSGNEGKVLAAALRVQRALYGDGRPSADADLEAEHASDLLRLAARELVREVENAPADQRPVGWDANPVHGTPRAGDLGMREYTCGECGEEFGSNCRPGDIECTDCEARLCSSCGHWDAQVTF